jgi:hypothetical protein
MHKNINLVNRNANIVRKNRDLERQRPQNKGNMNNPIQSVRTAPAPAPAPAPAQPVKVLKPVQSVRAVQPMKPIKPIKPIQSVRAIQPMQSVKPIQTVQSVQSVRAVQPMPKKYTPRTNVKFVNNIDLSCMIDSNDVYGDIELKHEKTKLFKNPDVIRCFITLTTVPSRFYEDEFVEVLKSLTYQTIKADKIFVSFCRNYPQSLVKLKPDGDRDKRIAQLKSMFPNVEVLQPSDYGPGTKILGLLEHNDEENFLSEHDLIIVVDDDMLYSKDLVRSHLNCYQIFNCDVVAVNQSAIMRSWYPYTFQSSETLYLDNYTGFLYGWLSFSITYKSLCGKATTDIKQFYRTVLKEFPDVFYHDDLLFSLFTYLSKLYVVESKFIPLYHDPVTHKDLYKMDAASLQRFYDTKVANINSGLTGSVTAVDARTRIDSVNALRNRYLPSFSSRKDLETKVYAHYGVNLRNDGFIVSSTEFKIAKNVPIRNIFLVDGLELVSSPEDMHVTFVYLNKNMMIMTVAIFNDKLSGSTRDISFKINDNVYVIKITIDTVNSQVVTKFSHVLKLVGEKLQKKEHNNNENYSIIQTSSSASMTKSRYYSISSLLAMSPEYAYKFFDDNDVFKFIRDKYSDMISNAVNNLVPGAYISDIFRYCYLYMYGGVYIDCKKTMYTPMSEFIGKCKKQNVSIKDDQTDIFVKDCSHEYAYNAVIVCDKLSKTIKGALVYSVYNIIKNYYCDDPLSVTGPGCLGKSVDYAYEKKYSYYYYNIVPIENHYWLSYVVDKNGKKVIKNSYYGYYEEGNYKTTNHYHNLWNDKRIYKKDLSKDYPNVKSMSDILLFKTK